MVEEIDGLALALNDLALGLVSTNREIFIASIAGWTALVATCQRLAEDVTPILVFSGAGI